MGRFGGTKQNLVRNDSSLHTRLYDGSRELPINNKVNKSKMLVLYNAATTSQLTNFKKNNDCANMTKHRQLKLGNLDLGQMD